MPQSEETSVAPNAQYFATTQWSAVLAAGETSSPASHRALELLCATYWYPLYAYVRRQGRSVEDAQDLTQAFFARLLERKDFRLADRTRGRFRTFLLASLKHFLINDWALVSCQSNAVAGFEAIIGHSPMNGTVLSRFNPGPGRNPLNVGSPPDYTTYTYTNGAWSPGVPTVAVGEAVFVYQPTNFVYAPAILNSRIVAANFTFDLETVYGRSVKIEYADQRPTNLWEELTAFVGDGHPRTIEDPSGVRLQRFYRIQSSEP